ncbi:MAG: hypothetical protein JSU61_04585 [Fidelibacterota bacterium]|nr:MAG: hypothetical protein JSU61_04585 [Candidatus Neomarinimicrobiota bacterium]
MKQLMPISLLLLFACTQPDPTRPDPGLSQFDSDNSGTVPFGEPCSLVYGESLLVGDDGLEVGFDRFLGDSRCPLEVQCFWEGQARIGLWLLEPGTDTLRLEPFISGYVFRDYNESHRSVFSEKYTITLHELDPYPRHDSTTNVADYTAHFTVSLNPFPLLQDHLHLVGSDTLDQLTHNRIDAVDIDSIAIHDDSLLVYVAFGGGCRDHDFFLFGSVGTEEAIALPWPIVHTLLLHDGHGDLCEAWFHRTLRFDLAPIRQLVGQGVVSIGLLTAPNSVLYEF